MDIFFTDPTEVPLPPHEVRIRALTAEPWPDGRRVRVSLEVDPFQVRPNADLVIVDENGREVAHANVIESLERKIEVTLHLRPAPESGTSGSARYSVHAQLYYADIDEGGAEDEIASAPAGGFNSASGAHPDADPLERRVIDQAQATFEIPDD
jgi:hypothetical protein